MSNALTWQKVTKDLYTAVLIQVAAGVLGGIFGVINFLNAPDNLAELLLTGDVGFGALDVLELICSLAAVGGCIWFFISLGNWKKVAEANDVPAIHKLWLASLLSIIGSVVAVLPVIGIVGSIVTLVGFIFYLLGVSALKQSATLPENAKIGANKLYIAMIIQVAAAVVSLIPVIGLLGSLCAIAGLIVEFLGWKDIANS